MPASVAVPLPLFVNVTPDGSGVAVGDESTVLGTPDGGATWIRQEAPAELAVSAGRLYIAGTLCENERPVAIGRQPDIVSGVYC